MNLLDAVRRRAAVASERRFTLEDWIAAQSQFSFGGHAYDVPVRQTLTGGRAEPVPHSFEGYVAAYKANGIVWACELVRVSVFSEARFKFRRLENGRPGLLFGDQSLRVLERPWAGGTTGDLLARMLLDGDLAGNAYVTRVGDELVRLRPDWVDILLEPLTHAGGTVGWRKVGYAYWEEGRDRGGKPVILLPSEVAHFAPNPDPLATYRGMSWLTPVVREIRADGAATDHKLKFFEHGATPNMVVTLDSQISPDDFAEFVERMDAGHAGVANAYKTLYLAGGADVSVVGSTFEQMSFKATQGAGETRIAAAAGVHPVIVGLSEGLGGSSLNAGNYNQARRRFADATVRPLWRNAAATLETLVRPPSGSELWYDDRDIPFLREDEKDLAEVLQTRSQAIARLVDAGYDAASVVNAVESGDLTLLQHSGLFSVQLQPAGADQTQSGDAGRAVELAGRLEGLVERAERQAEVERLRAARHLRVVRDENGVTVGMVEGPADGAG